MSHTQIVEVLSDPTKDFELIFEDDSQPKRKGAMSFSISAGGSGGTGGSSGKLSSACTKTIYNEARDYVFKKYSFDVFFNKKRNLFMMDGVVHIFIDQSGNLIETGIPTAIQEDYTYQIHVIKNKKCNTDFTFASQGEYKPELNILVNNGGTAATPTAGGAKTIEVQELISAVMGPFTGPFTIKVRKNGFDLFNQTFTTAKRYHLSIVTGLVGTNLSNPQNIVKMAKPDGTGNTLVADNPKWRGMVSVMAVFYPTPRSFLFEPTTFKERLGITVGTRIDNNAFQNLMGGLQIEFARGGSITAGAHFGERSVVAGYPNFKFGSDTFTGSGDPVTKKEWNVGLYVGVNLDLKIVQYFITGGTQPK